MVQKGSIILLVCISCIIAYYFFDLLNKSIFSTRTYRIYLYYYIISVLILTLGTRIANRNTNINLNPFLTYYTIANSGIQGLRTGGLPEMVKRIGWYKESIIKSELNVILFIPLGYLVPKSNHYFRCVWNVTWIGLGFSFAIEATQLLFCLGWFDTSDLLHNVIGTILGYSFYRFLYTKIYHLDSY